MPTKPLRWKKFAEGFETPALCMYPVQEGSHKVAHLAKASERSPDGYPVCKRHTGVAIRPAWREYVEVNDDH